MCGPALTAIAAVASAVGTFSQYQSASAAAKSNARVADANAEINRRAAADATQRGADDASKARDAYRKANATLRARVGSAGLIADSGTPLDIQEENAGIGELNALTIMNNAEREAYGFKVGEMNQTANAAGYRSQASSLMTSGLLNAGGTLVTGGANFYNKYGNPFKKGNNIDWWGTA